MRKYLLTLPFLIFSLMATGQDVKQDFADGEFFLAQEEYEEALYTYTKVYNAGYRDNANINYRIGICLLQISGRKTEAIPYLEKAVGRVSERYTEGSLKEENVPPDAHLYLGNAYRINMEFEKACEQYRLYEEYVGTRGNIESLFANQQITSCSNAVVALNDPVDYSVGNLGQVNWSHEQVFNRVVSYDRNTLAYMGKNPFYNGIYVCRKENGLWTKPYGINASVVSEGNMDVVGLSRDGNEMLLAVSDEFSSNIYLAKYENDRWNPAESLGRPINSRYYESHAAFSPDGKSIYFTSNRNESVGAMDIFRSDLQEDGSWGDPVNLGERINTQLNEETPTISPDGRRIYFSSQGHNSIGGFDVFYSELQPDGSWGEPVNLGYPLNTTDDDFTLSPTGFHEERIAYVFSNGEASQHALFKFEIIDREATPVVVPFEEPEEEVAEEAVEEQEVEVVASPIERYLIKPVFFEFDSYELSVESMMKLDDLASLLLRFPTLELTITGHTDAIGTYEYNQRLSENRAKAVKDYLVFAGVKADRLQVKGLSESEHVARNRTRDNRDAPEGRRLNRRSQFRLTNHVEEVIVEMEPIEVPDYLKIDE